MGSAKAKKTTTTKQARPRKKSPAVTVDLVKARADFVRHFIEQDFENATGAYKRAYGKMTNEVAAAAASRLLRDVKVQAALSTELEAVLKAKRRPIEKRVLDTWFVRAFYDPTEILDLHGNLKISEAVLRKRGLHVCIDSINRRLNNQGNAYIEYKLADRDKALDMLQRYIQMIKLPDANIAGEDFHFTVSFVSPKDAGNQDQ
ncbi:MAG: terminase small subunit [Rectinemataceae bacterium]